MFIFQDMYDLVITMLKNNLPEEFYYHNYIHTKNVVEQVKQIGIHENCTSEEIDLLQLAGLWHDTGFLVTYENHEAEGCRLAKKYLPYYGIEEEKVDKVCSLIMATHLPQTPKNKLEEIIADADLEYLGTDEAPKYAGLLYQELKHRQPLLDEDEWRNMQISFLKSHKYFTRYCIENLQPKKQVYLDSLLREQQ